MTEQAVVMWHLWLLIVVSGGGLIWAVIVRPLYHLARLYQLVGPAARPLVDLTPEERRTWAYFTKTVRPGTRMRPPERPREWGRLWLDFGTDNSAVNNRLTDLCWRARQSLESREFIKSVIDAADEVVDREDDFGVLYRTGYDGCPVVKVLEVTDRTTGELYRKVVPPGMRSARVAWNWIHGYPARFRPTVIQS